MRTAVCRSLIQDRPDTRIHSPPKEDKSSKRSEDVTSERVSDRESKKKSSKSNKHTSNINDSRNKIKEFRHIFAAV